MEQLVELLKQIQELAGVAVDALEGAGEKGKRPDDGQRGGKPEGKPEQMAEGEGGPPPEEGGPGGPPRR